MPESEIHQSLRYRSAAILKNNGWSVTHDNGDTTRPDIVATKDWRRWLIEIEWSGSNIERDLEQGAEIFVTTPDKLDEINRKVKWRAPVVDIDGFRDEVESRS
jgi:hypothetical protein